MLRAPVRDAVLPPSRAALLTLPDVAAWQSLKRHADPQLRADSVFALEAGYEALAGSEVPA